jgi:hypothetical protein
MSQVVTGRTASPAVQAALATLAALPDGLADVLGVVRGPAGLRMATRDEVRRALLAGEVAADQFMVDVALTRSLFTQPATTARQARLRVVGTEERGE